MKSLLQIPRHIALVVVICTSVGYDSVAYAQQEGTSTTASSTSLLDEQAFNDSFSKLPTNISADSLTLNAKQRIFTYKGNVTVEQGDMKLTSKTLEGTYTEDNQIQKLIAKGNVKITKQEIEATGQQALYDAPSATILLSDNPQLKQGESILTADRIKVFLKENRSQAEGAVRVTFVKSNDAQSPSFLNLGKDGEGNTRGTTAASVATPKPESKETPAPKEEKKKTGDENVSKATSTGKTKTTATTKTAKKSAPAATKTPKSKK
jgi:lipopolysaccharide export system protein LptA